MRITSGLFKSRIIKGPKHIRPTQDKVREGLFDIIRLKVVDSNFLELFAGSGAVGIEALSNGAKEVVFVEKDKSCCRIIEGNLSLLGLVPKRQNTEKNIYVLSIDALKSIEIFRKKDKKFDIVFLDPPYYSECSYSKQHIFGIPKKHRSSRFIRDKNLAKKTLQKLSLYDIVAPHGLIIVEHSKRDNLDETVYDLTTFKQTRYGDTVLSFYKKLPVTRANSDQ